MWNGFLQIIDVLPTSLFRGIGRVLLTNGVTSIASQEAWAEPTTASRRYDLTPGQSIQVILAVR